MFCCFKRPKTLDFHARDDEVKPLLVSGKAPLKYQTIITIPYAHVLRDDKIQYESSNVIDGNATETIVLFDSMIPEQSYGTACFSFDDVSVSTPVVIAATTSNGHILFERLFRIDPVTMARPFDEFLMKPTETNVPLDEKNNDTEKEPDKE